MYIYIIIYLPTLDIFEAIEIYLIPFCKVKKNTYCGGQFLHWNIPKQSDSVGNKWCGVKDTDYFVKG